MQRVLCKLKKFVPNFWYRNNIATGRSTSQIKAASGLDCIYKKHSSAIYLCQKGKRNKESMKTKLFLIYLDLLRTGLYSSSKFKDTNIYIFNTCWSKSILAGPNLLKQNFWKNIMPSFEYSSLSQDDLGESGYAVSILIHRYAYKTAVTEFEEF